MSRGSGNFPQQKKLKNLLTNKKNYDIINIESEGKRFTKKFLKKLKKILDKIKKIWYNKYVR